MLRIYLLKFPLGGYSCSFQRPSRTPLHFLETHASAPQMADVRLQNFYHRTGNKSYWEGCPLVNCMHFGVLR